MIRLSSLFILVLVTTNFVHGQKKRSGGFSFMEVPAFTKLSGLGGTNVSLNGSDVNFITSNPALGDEKLNQHLSLNYILYPGDIKISNVTYVTDIGSTGNWGVNLLYFNYGELEGYDPTGFYTGNFSAKEFAFSINKAHQIGNYRMGANLKYAQSRIENFSATALMFDLGGVFIHPQKDFSVGMTMKNVGGLFSDFTDQSSTTLPFDLQVGTSFKPTHMPVRFSVAFYELTNWQDINAETAGEIGIEEPSTVDEIFRHTIWGFEFLFGQNVEFLFGYDHKQRSELRLSESSGGTGFSYGLMFKVKSFEFGFSRRTYHVGGVSTTFTLTSALGSWAKSKNISE